MLDLKQKEGKITQSSVSPSGITDQFLETTELIWIIWHECMGCLEVQQFNHLNIYHRPEAGLKVFSKREVSLSPIQDPV